MKILIVEDDALLLQGLMLALEGKAMSVMALRGCGMLKRISPAACIVW